MHEHADPIAEAKNLLANRTPGDPEWKLERFGNGYGRITAGEVFVADIYQADARDLITAAPRLLQALIDLVPPEWVVVLGLCASCDHPFDDHEEDGWCWADGCESCGEYKPSRRYPPKPTREPAE